MSHPPQVVCSGLNPIGCLLLFVDSMTCNLQLNQLLPPPCCPPSKGTHLNYSLQYSQKTAPLMIVEIHQQESLFLVCSEIFAEMMDAYGRLKTGSLPSCGGCSRGWFTSCCWFWTCWCICICSCDCGHTSCCCLLLLLFVVEIGPVQVSLAKPVVLVVVPTYVAVVVAVVVEQRVVVVVQALASQNFQCVRMYGQNYHSWKI